MDPMRQLVENMNLMVHTVNVLNQRLDAIVRFIERTMPEHVAAIRHEMALADQAAGPPPSSQPEEVAEPDEPTSAGRRFVTTTETQRVTTRTTNPDGSVSVTVEETGGEQSREADYRAQRQNSGEAAMGVLDGISQWGPSGKKR